VDADIAGRGLAKASTGIRLLRLAAASFLFAGFSVKLVLARPEYLAQPMNHLRQHAGALFAIGMLDRISVLVGIFNMNQSQIHRAILHRGPMQSKP
jgi:hypothetical protein